MNRFLQYLRPYFGRMSLGLSIKFIGTMMDLLIPWILAHIIDKVVPTRQISSVFFWGTMMVLAAGIGLMGNIIANRMASRVARDTTERIRHDLFHKITYLSAAQIDRLTLPSLISRLTADTYHVHHMIGMMQRLGVRAPILLIGGMIVTLSLDPVLALVLIAVQPIIAFVVIGISRRGIPLFQSLQANIDAMVKVLRENITGVRIIKALSKGAYEKERFSTINDHVRKAEKKAGMTMALSNPSMNLLLNLGLSSVIIAGAFRIQSGSTQPGVIIAFLTYFTLILNAMLSISRIFILASKGFASFDRIVAVLEVPEDLCVSPPDYKATDAHIQFQDVSFSYYKTTPNLDQITFEIKKGQTLGIIGATGSGKSSLIRLLMRFYDCDEGVIRIGGHNIKSIPKEALHQKFGIVFQDDMLFADTIAQNIAFGRDVTSEDLQSFATLAQAVDFIDSLTERFDHQLTIKGANLSGGQRQRLLISRALMGKPEILILDDASSALDYRTDANLRGAIQSELKDTTTIVVAQRISSIMHADHILVMENGKILDQGSHDALLSRCNHYKMIAQIQLGGLDEVQDVI